MVRIGKRGLAIVAEAAVAFAQPKLNPQEIVRLVLEWRNQVIEFIHKNDLYLFMLVLLIPMLLLMYYDSKLIYRELRDITIYVLRRKELLPIEKRWYRWRIGMRAIGIVVLSVSIVLIAGALAWMAQFKHLSDMFAALDKLRREENLIGIIQRFLMSLRRR